MPGPLSLQSGGYASMPSLWVSLAKYTETAVITTKPIM